MAVRRNFSHPYLGTGNIIVPDYRKVAKDWATSIGRRPSPEDRPEWEELARRLNLLPGEAQAGWSLVAQEDRPTLKGVLQILKETLGPAGLSTTTLNLSQGYLLNTPGSEQWQHADTPSLPFHTKAAEELWKVAKKIAWKHPDSDGSWVIQAACEESGIRLNELTPEDGRVLELAIAWAQSGRRGPPPPGHTTAGKDSVSNTASFGGSNLLGKTRG